MQQHVSHQVKLLFCDAINYSIAMRNGAMSDQLQIRPARQQSFSTNFLLMMACIRLCNSSSENGLGR